MNKVTLRIAKKFNVFLEEFIANSYDDEDLMERHAKGMTEAHFIEIYNEDPEESCEWHVRYVKRGESYHFAGSIHGEDYPLIIENEIEFRKFIKQFASIYVEEK